MPFYVYILRCGDGSYYTGHTDGLERRLVAHQRGEIPGYTYPRRPVCLVFAEEFPSRNEAFEREPAGQRLVQGEERGSGPAGLESFEGVGWGPWFDKLTMSGRRAPCARAVGEPPVQERWVSPLTLSLSKGGNPL